MQTDQLVSGGTVVDTHGILVLSDLWSANGAQCCCTSHCSFSLLESVISYLRGLHLYGQGFGNMCMLCVEG